VVPFPMTVSDFKFTRIFDVDVVSFHLSRPIFTAFCGFVIKIFPTRGLVIIPHRTATDSYQQEANQYASK